jgi:hypothetical protein
VLSQYAQRLAELRGKEIRIELRQRDMRSRMRGDRPACRRKLLELLPRRDRLPRGPGPARAPADLVRWHEDDRPQLRPPAERDDCVAEGVVGAEHDRTARQRRLRVGVKPNQLVGRERPEPEPPKPAQVALEHLGRDVQAFLARLWLRDPVVVDDDVRALREPAPFGGRRGAPDAAPERRFGGEIRRARKRPLSGCEQQPACEPFGEAALEVRPELEIRQERRIGAEELDRGGAARTAEREACVLVVFRNRFPPRKGGSSAPAARGDRFRCRRALWQSVRGSTESRLVARHPRDDGRAQPFERMQDHVRHAA